MRSLADRYPSPVRSGGFQETNEEDVLQCRLSHRVGADSNGGERKKWIGRDAQLDSGMEDDGGVQ